jgi:hypothetical protein
MMSVPHQGRGNQIQRARDQLERRTKVFGERDFGVVRSMNRARCSSRQTSGRKKNSLRS